jgi:DNA-binding transcriptional regulator YdaS (Cro superfamily)
MAGADEVRELIKAAVRKCGSQAKLGARAGVKQASIWTAIQAGRVSAELALGIHRATGGEVPGSKLRPDLWARPEHVPAEGASA